MSAPALTVTETAAEQLKAIMDNQNLTDVGVRVFVRSACGCGNTNYGMGFDDVLSDDDAVIEHGGLKFYVSESDGPGLEGATIDFVETEMSRGFAIINPNGGGCGCGGH
jgi:iron-sulfur cluster assembly protein